MSDLVGNPEDRFSHNEAQMQSANEVDNLMFGSYFFIKLINRLSETGGNACTDFFLNITVFYLLAEETY